MFYLKLIAKIAQLESLDTDNATDAERRQAIKVCDEIDRMTNSIRLHMQGDCDCGIFAPLPDDAPAITEDCNPATVDEMISHIDAAELERIFNIRN